MQYTTFLSIPLRSSLCCLRAVQKTVRGKIILGSNEMRLSARNPLSTLLEASIIHYTASIHGRNTTAAAPDQP